MQRDWSAVAEAKAQAWQTGKRMPGDDLRTADQLRRYVQTVHPDWPHREDRRDDFRAHVRVSKALGVVRSS